MIKIPVDAFEYYVGLGDARSYRAVALHYGVNKRSVTRAARRERWSERLAKIHENAARRVDEKLTDDIAELKLRHQKLLRAVSSRAAQALAAYPLTDGMQGVRATEMVVKLERLIAGEASERTEAIIADVTREEMRRLLERDDAEDREG